MDMAYYLLPPIDKTNPVTDSELTSATGFFQLHANLLLAYF